MRLRVCLTMVVLALTGSTPAMALHGFRGGCVGGTDIGNPGYAVDTVDNGEADKYKLVVPAGQTGYLSVQPVNGDIDVYVCKGSGTHACIGHNTYPLPDGCHASELSDQSSVGLWEFGNSLDPGTYRVHVQHCFSSEDVPDPESGGSPGGCDYTLGQATEVGDQLPPVAYILLFGSN